MGRPPALSAPNVSRRVSRRCFIAWLRCAWPKAMQPQAEQFARRGLTMANGRPALQASLWELIAQAREKQGDSAGAALARQKAKVALVMDARFPKIAEQLLLIERELRVQGWWDDVPPSIEALSSVEPFSVDTLDFEQWLQWIFLPRMKTILEQDLPLPNASGIQEMAEMVFAARNVQGKDRQLQVLLKEFDLLITASR